MTKNQEKSGPVSLSPQEVYLSQLHGVSPFDEDGKNTILVVEGSENEGAITKGMLGEIFPNFKIEKVENTEQSPEAISDLLQKNVAMIVDTSDCGNGTSLLNIPVVTQPPNSSNFQCLDFAVPDAINIHFEVKSQIDALARPDVLADYIEFVNSAVVEWESIILEISGNGQKSIGDLEQVSEGVARMKPLAKELRDLGPELSAEDLSRIVHDMNNFMSIVVGFTDFLLIDGGLELVHADQLKEFEKKQSVFVRYTRALQIVYRGDTFIGWSNLRDGFSDIVPEPQKLELPKDLNVCVVDDCDEVLKYCSRVIADAGGNYFEAANMSTLREIKKHFGAEGIDLFLLDNDLGKGSDGEKMTGDQLIPIIKSLFPNTLVIAHTGDAEKLKGDLGNPYSHYGVEVVGKHQWNEVSRIVKNQHGQ